MTKNRTFVKILLCRTHVNKSDLIISRFTKWANQVRPTYIMLLIWRVMAQVSHGIITHTQPCRLSPRCGSSIGYRTAQGGMRWTTECPDSGASSSKIKKIATRGPSCALYAATGEPSWQPRTCSTPLLVGRLQHKLWSELAWSSSVNSTKFDLKWTSPFSWTSHRKPSLAPEYFQQKLNKFPRNESGHFGLGCEEILALECGKQNQQIHGTSWSTIWLSSRTKFQTCLTFLNFINSEDPSNNTYKKSDTFVNFHENERFIAI
jgi:hypothetical protein